MHSRSAKSVRSEWVLVWECPVTSPVSGAGGGEEVNGWGWVDGPAHRRDGGGVCGSCGRILLELLKTLLLEQWEVCISDTETELYSTTQYDTSQRQKYEEKVKGLISNRTVPILNWTGAVVIIRCVSCTTRPHRLPPLHKIWKSDYGYAFDIVSGRESRPKGHISTLLKHFRTLGHKGIELLPVWGETKAIRRCCSGLNCTKVKRMEVMKENVL